MPTHNPNEATTRQFLIDPALSKAGWNVNDTNSVGREIPADGFDPVAWAALRARLRDAEARSIDPINLPSGICDYALFRANGHVLAVVEAKRTSTDPQLAQEQAVQLSYNNGKSVAQTASDLGLPPNMLSRDSSSTPRNAGRDQGHRWRREAKQTGCVFPGHGKARDEEMTELKRRLKQAEMERDILKKAASFFAAMPK